MHYPHLQASEIGPTPVNSDSSDYKVSSVHNGPVMTVWCECNVWHHMLCLAQQCLILIGWHFCMEVKEKNGEMQHKCVTFKPHDDKNQDNILKRNHRGAVLVY